MKQRNSSNTPKTKKQFMWLSESTIRANHWDLNTFLSRTLRKHLPVSLYWRQPIPRGKIYWNWTLLHDYLLYGDRPEHQQLVEEFVASLQESA